MHEVFLQRIAAHAAMREDYNFRVFLEYGDEVRGSDLVLAIGQKDDFSPPCTSIGGVVVML